MDRNGSFDGFIGTANDVTDQKQAQEALEKMGGRLIAAQEEERSRIARELHDDICQRLALLSLELEQASQSWDGLSPVNGRLDEIRQHSSAIGADVQALSHQLHSSKLDYLGLGAALRSFCKEVAHSQEVKVDFMVEEVPTHLPANLSLCLFRVAQEALQNAVKHSGVRRFVVELRAAADEIELRVHDSGVGFDIEAAKEHGGSGLISMQERVHLVRGSFSIHSGLGDGTTVSVRVPLAAEAKASMLVAGSRR
jgi:signal transduction histidine kinase